MEIADKLGWKARWRTDKFRDPTGEIAKALQQGMPIEQAIKAFGRDHLGSEEWEHNVALNEGIEELLDIICGLGTPTKWDETNARLGVGDDTTAESATQTGLLGSNKTFKGMDTNYPQRSNQTAEWRATFGTGEGNHGWQEFTVVNAADDTGKNLNRKVVDKGTKASGETWTLSLKITPS